MAIQFVCPGCSQPIEVDDEIGGRSAACPYCQHVVSVPLKSTYDSAAPVTASPLGQSGAPHAPPHAHAAMGLHVGPPPDARVRAARKLGNCALISAGLVIISIAILSGLILVIFIDDFGSPTSQPSHAQLTEAFQSSQYAMHLATSQCASGLFALLGVVLGAASLARHKRGNWRAWVSLTVCIATLSCFGLSILGTMLTGLSAG
jgi:DNA-directed RNA polymerase subunit RPC12/RpoP